MFIPLFFAADSFASDRDECPVYFLTALYFLLSLFSIYPALSFKGLYRYYFAGFFSLFAGFALFRILRMFPQPVLKKHLSALLFSILLSAAAVFGFSGGRISATFGNPNFFGAVLAAAMPYALYFSLSKPLYLTHLLFFAAALLMTLSRASWIGLGAGLIFFIFAASNKEGIAVTRKKAALKMLSAAVLITAGLLIISPNFLGALFRRAASIFDMSDADIVSRFEGYAASLSMFRERPLFGGGPESFSILFRAHAPISFISGTGGLAHAGYSHCYPLQLLAETGLAGFGAWLFLIFILFKKALSSKDLFKKTAGAALAAFIVTNLFAFPSVTELMIFWFSAAVIYGPREGRAPAGKISRNKGRLAGACAAFLLLSLPLVSEIFFSAAFKSPDDAKAYILLRRAAMFFPADHHLMNAGKRCMLAYDETRSPSWIERAEYFFEKLVGRNPRHAMALNGLGVAAREKLELYKAQEHAARAEVFFKKAVANDPYLRAARVNLALLFEREGRFDEARGCYEEALEIYRDDQQMLFNSGVVSIKAGNSERALEFWYRLRDINPAYRRLGEYIKYGEAL